MITDDRILDEIDRLKDALAVDDVGYAISFGPASLYTAILAAYRENDAHEIGCLVRAHIDRGIAEAAKENIAKQDAKDQEDHEASVGQARKDWQAAA